MSLKSTEITRAEYLPEDVRAQNSLPDSGLVIIETRNPNLRTELKSAVGGYSAYLASLKNYKPADQSWDEA